MEQGISFERTAAREATRHRILDACERLMARFGFRRITMDDLAKEARVSKRTIYLYFTGKEDIGLSTLIRVANRVHGELRQIAVSDAEPEAKLRKLLERRVLGWCEKLQPYARSIDELFCTIRAPYLVRREKAFAMESEILVDVLSDPRFACANPKESAESMILATNAFLPFSLSDAEMADLSGVRERMNLVLNHLLRGLARVPA